MSCFLRFYQPLYETNDLRWRCLAFYVFTNFSPIPTPSGGHIFLCLKKDMEERQTKGLQSRPLESGFYTGVRRGDVRRPYEFARVQLTRFRPVRGVCKHTVSTDSCLLHVVRRKRWHLENNQPNLWSEVGWLHKSCCFSEQRTPRALPTAMLKPRLRGAARRAHGSSAEHAMRDLIASNAPLREGSHTARQNGPKHYPRGFKGIAIPLARLSPLSFAVQRKMEPTECAGLVERPVNSHPLKKATKKGRTAAPKNR